MSDVTIQIHGDHAHAIFLLTFEVRLKAKANIFAIFSRKICLRVSSAMKLGPGYNWIICLVLLSDINQNDYSQCEMHLLSDPLFSIPSDNTYMLSIKSTHNGRIFLAGKDGCLYEIIYQVIS